MFKGGAAAPVYLQGNLDAVVQTRLYQHIANAVFGDDLMSDVIRALYLQIISDVLNNRAQNEHIAPMINRLVKKRKDTGVEQVVNQHGLRPPVSRRTRRINAIWRPGRSVTSNKLLGDDAQMLVECVACLLGEFEVSFGIRSVQCPKDALLGDTNRNGVGESVNRRRSNMRARCSAVSRLLFGGCASLDTASAPCVARALVAGDPAHAPAFLVHPALSLAVLVNSFHPICCTF